VNVRIENVIEEQILNADAPKWERRMRGWTVDFSTPYGSGRGIFVDNEPPERLGEYDVELSIEEDFAWGSDIVTVPATTPAISFNDRTTTLRGMLESVVDGSVVIRIDDTLVSISANGSPPELGCFVEMRFKTMLLFPTHT